MIAEHAVQGDEYAVEDYCRADEPWRQGLVLLERLARCADAERHDWRQRVVLEEVDALCTAWGV